jgi:hypothetical protein
MGKSTHKLSFSVLPLVYTLRDNFKYRIDAVFAYLLTNIKMKTHSEANSDPFRGQSNYCGFVKVMVLFFWLCSLCLCPAQRFSVAGLDRDPWRIVDGVTNQTSPQWVNFSGVISQVVPDGLLICGWYGDNDVLDFPDGRDFFLVNFPYQVSADDRIWPQSHYVAKPVGTYTFTTVLGASRTLNKLDYGIISTPPPPRPLTPEEQAIVKAASAKRKKDAASAALKFNQDLAAKGDAYGQLRMGERYRDGDGVQKDLVKSHDLLLKSAAQGDQTAAIALEKLPPL